MQQSECVAAIKEGRFGPRTLVQVRGSSEVYLQQERSSDGNTITDYQFMHEIDLYHRIRPHPNLNRFIAFRLGFPKVFLLEPFNLSLESVLQSAADGALHPSWNPTRQAAIVFGVACGMMHLHAHDIYHRFLKPSRILLNPNLEPRIADYVYGDSDVPFHGQDMPYVAPELQDGSAGSFAGDVYSFGVILYEILTGRLLPPDSRLEDPAIDIGGILPRVIRACIHRDPARRPLFSQIVSALQNSPELLPVDGFDMSDFEDCAIKFMAMTVITPENKRLFETKPAAQPEIRADDAARFKRLMERWTRDGDDRALVAAGHCHARGTGVRQDHRRAFECFEEAARRENALGLFNCFECLRLGVGVAADPPRARDCLQAAAALGLPRAMYEFGKLLAAEGETELAKELLAQAAERGHGNSRHALGQIAEREGRLGHALCHYQQAGFDDGVNAALYDWARMKLDRREESAALEQFEHLARADYSPAQVMMGHVLRKGQCGLEANPADAAMWFRRAAKGGDPHGCFFYAFCLLRGFGCARDPDGAAVYYGRAIEHGNTDAMVNLGMMLRGGVDVPKDEQKAVQLFKRAADARVPDGMYHYGLCLMDGIGVPKQRLVDGVKFIEEAAQLGCQKAVDRLQELDNSQ
jgi:TPR repeat protein